MAGMIEYLAESFAVLSVMVAVDRVEEMKGCFSPLHRTCIRAIDSVTWQTPHSFT